MCEALFKERLVGDFAAFKMVKEVLRIEECMWEYTTLTTLFNADI